MHEEKVVAFSASCKASTLFLYSGNVSFSGWKNLQPPFLSANGQFSHFSAYLQTWIGGNFCGVWFAASGEGGGGALAFGGTDVAVLVCLCTALISTLDFTSFKFPFI